MKTFLKQNWFKLFITLAVLAYLVLFAFGKYVEVKAHNFSVMQMVTALCQGIVDEEEMRACVTPIIANEYISLPFFKIVPGEGKE